MKKIYYLILFAFTATGASAQNGQIMNGGFENWSSTTLYDYPTQWTSSNQDQFQGVPTLLKSTDASSGTYSVELRSEEIGPNPDTTFGYVLHGTVGSGGPDGGIPYTTVFNTVKFQYKCDLPVANDSMYMYIIRFVAGNPIEFLRIPAAGGTVNTWTQGSLTFSSTPQEELFIGFVMGDPMAENRCAPGAWARVDDVSLWNGMTQVTNVPDPSFENWSSQSIELPDDWYTLNEMLAGMGAENAVKTTDSYAGTYAIEMTTGLINNGQDTVPSFISIGAIDLQAMGMPFLPVPYVATPTTLSGAYKYAGVNGDQGMLQVIFFTNGSVSGQEVIPFPDQSSYTTFSTPLTIAETPDSMVLFAMAGQNPGSVLLLDALSFSGGNVGLAEFSASGLSIYPNPAINQVMIQLDGTFAYEIIDMYGHTLRSASNLNDAVEVRLDEFKSGTYFVRISNASKVETHQLIVE